LSLFPNHLLTDYLILPEIEIPQTALVKGDQRCVSIAAASILAKTARDALMCAYEAEYPGYGFARHKGYGTQLHRSTLKRLGRCAIHRKTFSFG
jgi:ribonuclease HII